MTARRTAAPGALTDLQQAILDILWRDGPSTAEQVREALAAVSPLKDSTVRTLLRRLEARGIVRHDVRGKVFVYRAKVGAGRLAARTVQQVIDRFWQGSAEQFLLGLVDEKVLTVRELTRLVARLERAKKGAP